MLSAFTCGTVLLLIDDALPTADASTECFEENLLPNGAFLPNSSHMSVSSLYHFLVLTGRHPSLLSHLDIVLPSPATRLMYRFAVSLAAAPPLSL
jgi:hypothetical protein